MKTFIRIVPIGLLGVFVIFGLSISTSVFAATPPDLGSASTFSIIGQTAITSIPTAVISGDVGMNASGASITGLTSAEVAGTIYATDLTLPSEAVLAASVQADASAAYTANIPGLPIEGTPIAVSELNGITRSAGVYDLTGAVVTLTGGVLTLDGPGVYIFRMPFAFTSAGSINLINGARACDVFWNVGSLATINSGGAGTEFAGTILSGTGVHFGAGVTLNGRAFAIGGDVTMNSDTISGPTCAPLPANLTVTKVVINDNGGTKVVADFPLFVGATPVVSGVAKSFVAGAYAVTETPDATYTQTFSGDCDASGNINLVSGSNVVCTVTNDDIAPLPPSSGGGSSPRPRIHVEKVATPDELPSGSGTVVYDYTVTNVGSIPINDVEVTDDKCDDVEFLGGDNDDDDRLDRDEEWTYQCTMTLRETTTNVVTARGESSSGQSTQDTDEATVVVSLPRIQPLPVVAAAVTTPWLPNAGIAPREDGLLWKATVPAFVLIASLGLFYFLRKKRIV